MSNIFEKLNMSQDYQKNKKLFNEYRENEKINDEKCVERLKFVLRIYKEWIRIKTNEQNDDKIIDIYDIINDKLDKKNYGIAGFLRDFRYLVSIKRAILPYMNDSGDVGDGVEAVKDDLDLDCDIDSCFVCNRLNRNRSDMTINNDKRLKLFSYS